MALVTWGTYSTGGYYCDNLVKLKTGTGYAQGISIRNTGKEEESKKDFLRKVNNRIAD